MPSHLIGHHGFVDFVRAQVRAEQTWALMFGLAGYTLLLAVTACLLVRFGGVWDDVRTVLLLVVLMFLATSVTFDEALARSPVHGAACYLVGWLFATLVSEGLLRGMRLGLPPWFRGPYYLILSLFFSTPGIHSAAGSAEKRGVGMALVRLLDRGGPGVPDLATCDQARAGLRPRQWQPLAMAPVSVGPVRVPWLRRRGEGVLALLVDAAH